MKCFAARNLTERTVVPCLPWEFVPTENITEQIRHDKAARQRFYRDAGTRHQFYSFIESHNPNQRASREDNPPRLLHGIAADFDVFIPEPTIAAAIASMPIKPAWIERSLGGNVRLVWLFSRPLAVESYEFCSALLQASIDWLRLGVLPGLDANAFTDPTRLYANGCNWSETTGASISEVALQTFFVDIGRSYRFVAPDGIEIPLELIEKALSEKFPNFCWPSEFAPETTGPSFWIPDSKSSNSAILKVDGFFSFSAHATQPFYTWADILGAEFVKRFTAVAVTKATSDVWFDGKRFWRKKGGCYTGMEMTELSNFLKVDCGIKGKQLDAALSHIYNENHVENASPYLFRPSGLLMFQGKRRLNTAQVELVKPATGIQSWGPLGNFPFLSALLDNIFTSEIQRDHFLAWFAYFYNSGLNSAPTPGQVIFLMGGVATGKTFTSREVVGRAMGGYVDASGYIIRSGEFNSHLFEAPLWVLDDDTISDSPQAAANVQAMLKKSVANSSFLSNKKFQVAGMLEWYGRVLATTNLDYVSSRMLGPLDNSTLDKISVYRCQKTSKIKFPARTEMERLVSTELPFLLRYLVDHTPPDHVQRDSRFGYCAWHENTLMEQAHQTSKSAPFKEVLLETLDEFFQGNPEMLEWRGTVSRLIQQLHANPAHECVIRTLRLEQVSRYLESIEKDASLGCRVETGPLNTRVWIFPRIGEPPKPIVVEVPPQGPSIFDK